MNKSTIVINISLKRYKKIVKDMSNKNLVFKDDLNNFSKLTLILFNTERFLPLFWVNPLKEKKSIRKAKKSEEKGKKSKYSTRPHTPAFQPAVNRNPRPPLGVPRKKKSKKKKILRRPYFSCLFLAFSWSFLVFSFPFLFLFFSFSFPFLLFLILRKV